jgi:hypothetical protein
MFRIMAAVAVVMALAFALVTRGRVGRRRDG